MSNASAAAYYQQYQQQAAQYQQQMAGQQTHQKYKSTLCNVWLMEGVCARGRLCHYAHGIRELNYSQYYNFYGASTPTMTPGSNIIRQGQDEYNTRYYKTALCQFWQQRGNCNNGDQCRWAHGEAELRQTEQYNGEGTTEQQHVMIGPQLEGPLTTTTTTDSGAAEQQQEQQNGGGQQQADYEPARKRNRDEYDNEIGQ